MCCLDPNDFDENNYNNQKNCNNYNNVYTTLPAMSLITAGTDTGKSCAIARWRRGGAGGGGACEGETSGVKVHHKVLRQDRHPEQLSQKYKFMYNRQ